jgi:lipopolysaccharide export LptBFGC system permease protein LptF
MGLTFLLHTEYQLPLTVGALLLAVGPLGFRAGRRRGYRPLAGGILAAAFVILGKFVLDFAAVTYGGIAMLIAASIWNSWPLKRPKGELIELGLQKRE